MKKIMKIVFPAIGLIAIIALAYVLYHGLSRKFTEEQALSEASDAEKTLEKAADFTVYDTEGNAVKLSEMTGKPVIVNFWATWCGYCVQELPDFDRCAEEYGDRLSFMMVDLPDGQRETEEKALAFAEEQGYGFPVYFDTDLSAASAYRISGIPLTLLIDAEGNLLKKHTGAMDEETLKQYIELLTADEE